MLPILLNPTTLAAKELNDNIVATMALVLPFTGKGIAVTVTGPVVDGGVIHIVAGDDYKQIDGRALEWTSLAWVNLTGASVKFIAGSTEIAMSIVTSGAGEQKVRLELTKAQTAALTAMYEFKIIATLSNSNVATLVKARGYVE